MTCYDRDLGTCPRCGRSQAYIYSRRECLFCGGDGAPVHKATPRTKTTTHRIDWGDYIRDPCCIDGWVSAGDNVAIYQDDKLASFICCPMLEDDECSQCGVMLPIDSDECDLCGKGE